MKKFLLLLPLLLAACEQTTDAFVNETEENTKPARAAVADVIFPEVNHEQVVQPVPKVEVHPFCYSTWDKPVCYTHPQIGREQELIGENPI